MAFVTPSWLEEEVSDRVDSMWGMNGCEGLGGEL